MTPVYSSSSPTPHPQRNLNSVASETVLRGSQDPCRDPRFSDLSGVGSGGEYLFAGVKLRSRSLSHLEGGPNPEQQPQKPECARLGSSPAPGRGMKAVPRLSHSVVLSERQQRFRCCGCSYCWKKAEKKGREVHRGEDARGWARFSHLPAATPRQPILPPPSFLFSSSYPRRLGNRLLVPSARVGHRTTSSSAAHLPVAMAAAATGARGVGMRVPRVCNRPNRRSQGSCKERGGNNLQAIATKFIIS